MANRTVIPKESHAPSVFATEIEGFTAKSKLSRRESEIVVSLIRNITNSEEIAKSLGISTHTVNNHLKSIFEKTSTKSKTEILSTFLRYAADRLQGRSLFVRRPRVLVLGAQQQPVDQIASGLMDRGMRTHASIDAASAVEIIAKFNIDVVICDVKLAHSSGLEVLKTVRNTFRSWPYVLFMGEATSEASLAESMHYGAAGFVDQPLNIELLFRTIMGHLTESGEERAEFLTPVNGEPMVLGDTFRLDEQDLGFGGAFLALDGGLLKKKGIGVGALVDVSITPSSLGQPLKVRGQIVWKRPVKDNGLKAGIGLRFIKMSDQDQATFDRYLQGQVMTSFIPMGTDGAGTSDRAVGASR